MIEIFAFWGALDICLLVAGVLCAFGLVFLISLLFIVVLETLCAWIARGKR